MNECPGARKTGSYARQFFGFSVSAGKRNPFAVWAAQAGFGYEMLGAGCGFSENAAWKGGGSARTAWRESIASSRGAEAVGSGVPQGAERGEGSSREEGREAARVQPEPSQPFSKLSTLLHHTLKCCLHKYNEIPRCKRLYFKNVFQHSV